MSEPLMDVMQMIYVIRIKTIIYITSINGSDILPPWLKKTTNK